VLGDSRDLNIVHVMCQRDMQRVSSGAEAQSLIQMLWCSSRIMHFAGAWIHLGSNSIQKTRVGHRQRDLGTMIKSASCRICGSAAKFLFAGKVLQVHDVSYFQCDSCGFVQTEDPWWLPEAYTLPMNYSDTGLINRNVVNVRKTATALFFLFNREGSFLDYGGGWGLFTRMMRDAGFDFYWHDPHCENIFARGFSLEDSTKDFDVVTAFEVLEHVADPVSEVKKLLSLGRNVIFSTLLLPEPAPALEKWWYYSPEHGQHISFYTRKSLLLLASKLGLHFASNNSDFHVLSSGRITQTEWQVLGKASRVLFPLFVRRRMASKTGADMHHMKKRAGISSEKENAKLRENPNSDGRT
jgi:hypothetical protein